MKLACEILTADPEGGAARIPFNLFQFIYKYLVELDGEIPQEHVNAVLECLEQQVYVTLYCVLRLCVTTISHFIKLDSYYY